MFTGNALSIDYKKHDAVGENIGGRPLIAPQLTALILMSAEPE
jgi:hypothetical protein